VPPIDDFFDGLITHYALLGACSGDARCRILLDSSATASCIAKNNKMLKALCTAVVDPSPNAGVKVGSVSAEVLNVDKVVNLCFGGDLGFDGYRVVNGLRVKERGELQCHNVLVVDGLDVDVILLSVRDLLEPRARRCQGLLQRRQRAQGVQLAAAAQRRRRPVRRRLQVLRAPSGRREACARGGRGRPGQMNLSCAMRLPTLCVGTTNRLYADCNSGFEVCYCSVPTVQSGYTITH